MRKILGFVAVLVASSLAGTAGWAYGQAGAGGQGRGEAAGVSGRVHTSSPSSLITAPNNLEQQANENALQRAAGANAAAPGQTAAVPGQPVAAPGQPIAAPGQPIAAPGQPIAAPGQPVISPTQTTTMTPRPATTTPANTYQNPAMTGAGINPAGGAQSLTGNTAPQAARSAEAAPLLPGTPGEWNYRGTNPSYGYSQGVREGVYPGTSTAATPGYTNRVMPGMAGYSGVNPMPTTMAPGYYYADTAGMPYARYNNQAYGGSGNSPYGYGPTTAYPSTYAPGTYVGGAPGYVVRGRGLFGRRARVVYPAGNYGYNTYSSYPSGYSTYGATSYYTTPGTTRYYGTTTYMTPGTYTYGAYPY